MEIQDARGQLDREIAVLDERIGGRNAKITELQLENAADQERQQTLKEAQTAVSVALAKLQEIGPLLAGESIAAPAAAVAMKDRKRVPALKKYVLPILDEAGRTGLLDTEVVEHLKIKHGFTVALSTVRPFLRKLKQDGKIERTAEKRWRETGHGVGVGEVRQSVAAD